MSGRLSPDERALARHALGLPNANNRSYRNRFAALPGSEPWHWWNGMCERGLAYMNRGSNLDYFGLTEAAATLALELGETLDEEDFYA